MTTTFYFNDIFPDLDTFTVFCESYGIYDTGLDQAANTAMTNWAWQELFARYSFNSVQYDTPDAFKVAFAQVLRQHWAQYSQQIALIKKVVALTDDEYLYALERIVNQSYNPNSEVEDPRKPLNFISAQTFETAHDNKMRAFLDAVNAMPSTRAIEFCDRFKFLFTQYFYQKKVYYPVEE